MFSSDLYDVLVLMLTYCGDEYDDIQKAPKLLQSFSMQNIPNKTYHVFNCKGINKKLAQESAQKSEIVRYAGENESWNISTNSFKFFGQVEATHPVSVKPTKENFQTKRDKENKILEKLDAVIIGSGIGGLTVAAILSRAGKCVLVSVQLTLLKTTIQHYN